MPSWPKSSISRVPLISTLASGSTNGTPGHTRHEANEAVALWSLWARHVWSCNNYLDLIPQWKRKRLYGERLHFDPVLRSVRIIRLIMDGNQLYADILAPFVGHHCRDGSVFMFGVHCLSDVMGCSAPAIRGHSCAYTLFRHWANLLNSFPN